MHFKKKIQNKVYHYYLSGFDVTHIAILTKLDNKDVNEIIDHLNFIYEV